VPTHALVSWFMKTKDSKRARVVRSKDREVVGPGYSRLIGATTKVTDRGGGGIRVTPAGLNRLTTWIGK
jgi:hypothetical protein